MSKRNYGAAFGRIAGAVGSAMLSRYANSGTQTITHRFASGGPAGGVRFSRERHRVGRKKRRESVRMRDVLNGRSVLRMRWQATSNSLVGPGKVPLGYGLYTGTNETIETLPIHFISLTNMGLGQASQEKGVHLPGLVRTVRDKSNGTIGFERFEVQESAGVNAWDTTGHWQVESNVIPAIATGESFFHKWSEVRMNLYGAKYIPLTYTIKLIQVPQEYDIGKHPYWTPGVALPYSEFDQTTRWIEDVSRGLIANPINVTGTKKEYKSSVKVLKSYSVTIAPLSYSNAASETSAPVHVGNVRQFKTFIRHDRFRQYDWAENAANVTTDKEFADLGFDTKHADVMYCDVKWGQKVYMMISCTTGPLVNTQAYDIYVQRPFEYTEIPNYEGTYDILVRNEFLHTK